WLLDFHRPQACKNSALRHVAIAHDLSPATVITLAGVGLHPVSNLSLDRIGQHIPSALAKNVAEDIFAAGPWHRACRTRRKLHGGVLLGLVGQLGKTVVSFSQSTPPFFFGYPQDLAIAQCQ